MIFRLCAIIIIQVFLISCNRHYSTQKQDFNHYSLKESESKKNLNDSIVRFKNKVDAETSRVIAFAEGELTKDGNESTLGNFVCDALKYAGEKAFTNQFADVVIVNRGGLRVNLSAGEIKVLNIFELMPFENELVLVKIKGKYLKEVLSFIYEKKHPFLGMKITKQNFTIGEKEMEPEKIYNLFTSDYLANGGDNFVFLKQAEVVQSSNLKIRDAIISYCDYLTANNKKINPYKDGRLELSK